MVTAYKKVNRVNVYGRDAILDFENKPGPVDAIASVSVSAFFV